MNRPGHFLLLLLATALPGSQTMAQTSSQVDTSPAAEVSSPPFSAQSPRTTLTAPDAVEPALSLGGLTRWSPLSDLSASADSFELKAAAGTSVTLSQVSSTVFELSDLEVSGLGNAGNAALEQQLRASFRALDGLGQSQSRTVQLGVQSRTAAGTELSTRWSAAALPRVDAQPAEVQLTQLLLPGGLLGPVQVSSPDPQQAARYRLMSGSELDRLSLIAGAPYGTALDAGDRVSGLKEQDLQPIFSAVLGAAQGLVKDWELPAVGEATLAPLELRLERVYQGQNSRGDHLFQTQGRAEPWQRTLDTGRSSLTLEVPDSAQMSQAVFRSDGLPHSAFEFSTLQLQITARQGAAQVRFAVQVRTTSALRPVGS